MRLKAEEIAKVVNGSLKGDPDFIIEGAAGLLEAAENDISFLGNKKYTKFLKTTKAGIIILPENEKLENKNIINVKNPILAFSKVLELFAKEKEIFKTEGISRNSYIAKTAKVSESSSIGHFAVIEENAEIGNESVIHSGCYIGKDTKIGSKCIIYPNVTIRERVSIGNNVIIHSGTVIGSDGFGFVSTKEGHYKIPQIGTIRIEDNVEIGANVTVDRATTGITKIGRGTKIDNLVQIAHNVEIGQNCIIVAAAVIAGSAKIGNNVILAGQSGVSGHIEIGDNVIIAAKSAATQDIKAGEMVSGFPARPHKDELKIQALMQKLPEIYKEIQKLKKKGK